MSKVFISYRRDDSAAEAGRIYDRLVLRFGADSVFKDVDDILPGADFRKALGEAVGRCQVLLAVIGRHWLTIAGKSGARRLEDARDFVRLEIEAALRRDIPVIPVLVSGAEMPGDDQLPQPLQELAFRHAVPVRHDPDFHRDMDRLLKSLDRLLQPPVEAAVATPVPAVPGAPSRETINSIGMKFAWIEPGSFLMGSDNHDGERPVHRVTITRGFYMGVYPVTQQQWQEVMGNNPSRFKGDDSCPVEQVSWEDCRKFCDALKVRDGRAYRLPTEAEWEYACRAGTTTEYYTGDGEDALKKAGWYGGNSGRKTHPVGQLASNARGLYDMHGNVWEWCQDWYGPYPKGDVTDYIGSKESKYRVLRGGSWVDDPSDCRAAYRLRFAPSLRHDLCGCRVVFCLD